MPFSAFQCLSVHVIKLTSKFTGLNSENRKKSLSSILAAMLHHGASAVIPYQTPKLAAHRHCVRDPDNWVQANV